MTKIANSSKNGALLAYIANRIPNINLRKLIKIVFLIDEAFTLRRGFPITWFRYYAWAKGPVAREVYEIKNGNFKEYVHADKNAEGKWVVNSNESHQFEVYSKMQDFSNSEMKEIDELLDRYADLDADHLTAVTHAADSLWSRVVADNHLTFINEKTSDAEIPLTLLIEDDDELLETYADAKWNAEFQGMIR